jgi:hypothetical protein
MPAISDPHGAAGENRRRVHLAFEDPKAFVAEYANNLSRGGAMFAHDGDFEAREIVDVVLEAPFASAKLVLVAEIVHAGGGSVAVQFLDATPELRNRLEPLREKAERLAAAAKPRGAAHATDDDGLLGDDADDDLALDLDGAAFDLDADAAPATPGFETHAPSGAETDPNERTYRARADRAPARVAAEVRGPTGKALRARTRDVSATGMLLSVEGEELPIGRAVQVSIVHPTTGEQMTVPAKVVRHLEGDGVVGAVAVEIQAGALSPEMQHFVSEVQEADAQQRSAGIRGPLEELGGASMLQMFAALSRRGTLTVNHGVEEGIVVFEDGMLRIARVGAVVGTKALARILAWRDGFFEFRSHVDPVEPDEAALPMEAAILEALRVLDEEQRHAAPALPPGAKLAVERSKLAATGPPLGKTEQAVLELATAGFTVRRILDVIPENDAVIRSAIQALLDRGLVRLA